MTLTLERPIALAEQLVAVPIEQIDTLAEQPLVLAPVKMEYCTCNPPPNAGECYYCENGHSRGRCGYGCTL